MTGVLLNNEFTIYVTHVDTEGPMLRIWGQIDKPKAMHIESLISKMDSEFKRGLGAIQIDSVIVPHTTCCAYHDDGYYRARLCRPNPGTGAILVHFIDYGNTETVSYESIRILNDTKEGIELQTIDALATDFVLADVLPIRDFWDSQLINMIKHTLRYNEMPGSVCSVLKNTKRVLRLRFEGQDFSTRLINERKARRATNEDFARIINAQPQALPPSQGRPMNPNAPRFIPPSENHYNNNHFQQQKPKFQSHQRPVQENWRQQAPGHQPHVSPRNPPQATQTSPPKVAQSLVNRVLKYRKYPVLISFVEDGPIKFAVQPEETLKELGDLMRNINSCQLKLLSEPPIPGSVCLGRYSKDGILRRAVVRGVTDTLQAKVFYIDYGSTEVLGHSDIYEMPSEFAKPQVFSVRFTLSGIRYLIVTEEMKKYFQSLVEGKRMILDVVSPEDSPLTQYGHLYDNDKNILDLLIAKFPACTENWPEAREIPRGAKKAVHVAYVESCSKFYVQLDEDMKALEKLTYTLDECIKTAPPVKPSSIKPGYKCLAHCSVDSQWYRAQVTKVLGNQVVVHYVDYGNDEKIPTSALRTVGGDVLTRVPALGIKCMLHGFVAGQTVEEVDNKFEEMVLDKGLEMGVLNVQSGTLVINLYDRSVLPPIDIFEQMKAFVVSRNANEAQKEQKAPAAGRGKRSAQKAQPPGQHQKPKSKKPTREEREQWKSAEEPRASPEKPKKSWKDEENEQKRHEIHARQEFNQQRQEFNHQRQEFDSQRNDNRPQRQEFNQQRQEFNHQRQEFDSQRNENRPQRQANQEWQNPPQNFQQNRENSHHNRENSHQNDRFPRNDRPNRSDQDFSNRSREFKDNRGSRGKSSPHSRTDRNSSAEKWSDKDSDTSSRSGSHKSGRGASRARRNDYQRNSRDSSDNERGFKLPRANNFNNSAGRGPRDFSGNDRRFSESKDTRKSDKNWETSAKPKIISIPAPNITLGAVKNCELIYIVSPCDFHVILIPDIEELTPLKEKITAFYESGGQTVSKDALKPGLDVIAQYSVDSDWYRARVESVGPSGASVYFLDYGNHELVPFDKLRELQEDFAKLPAQAVRCKLLAASKTIWDSNEIQTFTNSLDMKSLEAEFVGQEDDIFEVLLKEVVDGVPQTTYINEQYSNGADLKQAKDNARNRNRKVVKKTKPAPDYAPLSEKWKEAEVDTEGKLEVMVTWLQNPNNFYCQSLRKETEFRNMMNEIQNVYAGRTPISEPLEVGTSVMAVFAEDGALYRAEILELNKLRGNIVRYVDFGNCAMVDVKNTFRVEKKFMELPKQAFNCSLKNIVPASGKNWEKSNSHEIDKIFNVDKIECTFHEVKDNKHTVSLSIKGTDVAGILVEKGLADFAASAVVAEEIVPKDVVNEQNLERIDISMLEGQCLRVKVSNVEGCRQFHVQLPSAPDCEKSIAEFMAGKDPKVLPKLSEREVFLGSGCLVETKDAGWQRAVVISISRGFEIRLIDTGAKQVIPVNCMVALPAQLAVMQNQAVECYLKNVVSTPEVDKIFKSKVQNNEVIIRVDNVDNNRLAVTVFGTTGVRLTLTPSDRPETISPLLPMPIMHSSNKVTISHINHSKSIFIQRVSDIERLQILLEELYTQYSMSERFLKISDGKVCAAKSEDENWYRAKVIKKTEKGALVVYLDYGNTEDIPETFLKELDPDHLRTPQLALEVALPVSLKGTEAEQEEILKPYLLDKELNVSLYHIRNQWVAEFEIETVKKLSEVLSSLNLVELEPKKLEVDPSEPEELIVGGKYKIAVTHADNPAQFWIQRLRDVPAIDELQEKLEKEVDTYSIVEGIPEENLFCAAMYSADGLWYRAEVIDADEEYVTVRFVDFGNTDVIMRGKHQIKHLPDSMKSVKRYGIKCRLDLVPPTEEDWSENTCERFSTLYSTEEFIDAVVIADGTPKRVELFVNDLNIGDKLVEEKLAIKVHGADDFVDEIVERELDPHSAFVSHINSPSEFWVQEEKFVADLETIADRFVIADMYDKIDDTKEGMLCVAKFPEDQAWYRAKVISHGDTGTNVIYIDYGNSAVSTEIREIPEDLAKIPPLSRKCCLPLPEGVSQWSEQACEEFTKMADDGATIFILEVIEDGETSKVKLLLDGKDIAEPLAELCEKPVPIIEDRLSPLGEETSPNVVVSHVVSPSEFWIQNDYKMAELDVMADHLANAQSFLPLTSHEEGTICAAQFPEDGLWYRAKILCHSEAEIEVLYIDYGNSAVTSELRALPEDIIKIPALSMFSSLKLPDDLECWSQEAVEKFIELVADGATMFEYEEIGEDDPSVIKLILDGQDVVEILAPLCKKKAASKLDDELKKVVEDIQNMRDSVLDATLDAAEAQNYSSVETREEVTINKSGDEVVIQTESISEQISSSTSGVDVNVASDQSTTSFSVKLDSSADDTIQKPDGINKNSTTISEASEVIHETSSMARELTADDIVELYYQPPFEEPEQIRSAEVTQDISIVEESIVKEEENEGEVALATSQEKLEVAEVHVEAEKEKMEVAEEPVEVHVEAEEGKVEVVEEPAEVHVETEKEKVEVAEEPAEVHVEAEKEKLEVTENPTEVHDEGEKEQDCVASEVHSVASTETEKTIVEAEVDKTATSEVLEEITPKEVEKSTKEVEKDVSSELPKDISSELPKDTSSELPKDTPKSPEADQSSVLNTTNDQSISSEPPLGTSSSISAINESDLALLDCSVSEDDKKEKKDGRTSPGTPKTPHSEKLVAGVVTDPQLLQVEDEDEVLIVESTSK